MIRIDVDSREHEEKNNWILDYFFENGIYYRYAKLDTADYRLYNDNSILIDRKSSIMEIAHNLLSKEHERFKREILRSVANKSKLYILIEDENIRNIDQVKDFQIPTYKSNQYKEIINKQGNLARVCVHKKGDPRAKFNPLTLSKVMKTQEEKYGFACHNVFPSI